MTITLNDLKAAGACDWALRTFAEAFPNGATSVAEIAFHPDWRPEWRGWMAAHLPQCDRKIGLALIEYSGRPDYWRGYTAAHAHWCDSVTGLYLIKLSGCPTYWYGYNAIWAHWCDREMALDLIERTGCPECWRVKLSERFAA